jgi:DNA-binding IclR family transcriptional regulator
MEDQKNDNYPSKTLARGLMLLDCFTTQKNKWGVRSLSRQLGFPVATVHRLLTTFEKFNYLEKDPETNLYMLGPKTLGFALLYYSSNPLPKIATEVFKKHTDRWPYNLYLARLKGDEAIYEVTESGTSPIKINVTIGEGAPLHTTAMGKALLAYKEDNFLENYINNVGLRIYTPNTITDPNKFREEIQKVRQNGYSLNNGEHIENVGAVGVPLFDLSDTLIGSVSLAFPIFGDFTDDVNSNNVNQAIEIALEIKEAIRGKYLNTT